MIHDNPSMHGLGSLSASPENDDSDFKTMRNFAAAKTLRRATLKIKVTSKVELEGFLYPGHTNKPFVILVHQWSILGGSLHNMAEMARKLREMGYNTVVFNMRGVGRSTGSPTVCGCTEPRDVEAVVREIISKNSAREIYILGSSAGAPISGSVINNFPQIKGYIGIGYLFGWATAIFFCGHYPPVLWSSKRRLFINGSCDMFTSPCEFLCCFWPVMWGPRCVHTIPGVGHFEMEGPDYDEYMANLVDSFIKENDIPQGSYGCGWYVPPISCCSTCVMGIFALIILLALFFTIGLSTIY
ncbi:hypothetical protein AAMO2058_000598600 [Amorphochlora amoebiformis]